MDCYEYMKQAEGRWQGRMLENGLRTISLSENLSEDDDRIPLMEGVSEEYNTLGTTNPNEGEWLERLADEFGLRRKQS